MAEILFDTRPKTEKKDFFDREKEIEELKDIIAHRDFAAVLGIRRIGKTSLVRVTLNELSNYMALSINLGKLGNKKSYPMEIFSRIFIEGSVEVLRKNTFAGKVSKIIANRLGIDPTDILELNWVKISIRLREFNTHDVNEVVRALDSISKDNGKYLVIFIDEVQNIKKIRGFDLGSFLHDIYEWCNNTIIVVSGSFVGVTEEILNQVEEEKPFFGRKFFRIKLDRFNEEKSKEFLKAGFTEEGIEVNEKVLEEAIRLFDGIPGWLALFGRSYSYAMKHSHQVDIKIILKEAAKEVSRDFTRFLKSSNSPMRYAETILAISRLGNKGSLSEIRESVNSLFKEEIEDSRLHELLGTLINYGFIIKIGRGKYSLPSDLPTKLGLKHSAKNWIKKMS
ncbi:AAA family ATPase [Acidianus brierleyi]|uniref:AAA family ATPase n=1 Tax=Acidianus brierleyi TaxID=41673 RepID=UPI00144345CA|nr:ATP-binding protein [Acidianus brierleyi]